jgi:hypothetical protein
MGTKSSKTSFPEFFVDTKSAESVQRQFIDAPLQAALQSGIGPALEVANLLRILPDAFAASQRSELDRIKQSADKNDPRIAALEESIEQADGLRKVVRLAEIRTQRSLIAIATRSEIFHGFVSDSRMNPLEGLTVQVTAGKAGTKNLSDTTDCDGYFSISLGKTSPRPSEKEAANITPEQIAELFARQEKEREEEQLNQETGEESRVEILKKGKLLHEDPAPIRLDDGGVYREYVISDKASPSKPDSEESPSSPGYKSTRSPGDSKEHAAKVSPASENEPSSSASRRSPAKKSASAKSTKRTSKK